MKYNKLIFELSSEGRTGYRFGETEIDSKNILNTIPKNLLREDEINLPQVSEGQVVRHYTNLSNKNYGVDTGMYPLGSCTMKYNPKINEKIAASESFTNVHPLWPASATQGSLQIMYELQQYLKEITGMAQITLQPAAGSQGELTGLMIIKKYLKDKGEKQRINIIIPDSSHGTNPASVGMVGFKPIEIKSNEGGTLDIDALKAVLDEKTAGLMLTNPNTLGLFEKDILTISQLVHEAGGLLYYDGANMNANMGITRPREMGFDIVHLNLHKTFSTPHGGGGPGSGPVGVVEKLKEYVPSPIVSVNEEGKYYLENTKESIGQVKSFYGNFSVILKTYAYILTMGGEGLKRSSELAVLNANYMKEKLKDDYNIAFDKVCKHEFVLQGVKGVNDSITTLDIAKRLMDYGVHPPTIYFPLIVEQALMFEPTETETKESIDEYIDILIKIKNEAIKDPNLLKEAPREAPVRRLDEVGAARNPIVKY